MSHCGRDERKVVNRSSRGIFEDSSYVCERVWREGGLHLRMLPAWLLSPPWTLLACCFSQQRVQRPSKTSPQPLRPTQKLRSGPLTFTHTHTDTWKPPSLILCSGWTWSFGLKPRNSFEFSRSVVDSRWSLFPPTKLDNAGVGTNENVLVN